MKAKNFIMKKIKSKGILLIILLIPFLTFAQENESAMHTVKANRDLVAQLGQLLPMGINPYATVFLTSILSKSNIQIKYP